MEKRQLKKTVTELKRVRLSTWLSLVLGTAVLVALIGWLASWGFRVVQDWTHLQQNPTDATQKQFNASLEIVKAIVGGIGTLATIVGGIVLYLNFRVANKNAETAIGTVKVANRNAELIESRLSTERFSKAVEQLGSDKIEIRLGGIYALERIAQDSVRDHWTIMEVLTAFVRERSPVEPIQKPQVKESFAEHYLQPQSETEAKLTPVTKDVQAALAVIGRREVKKDRGRLDLSYSRLRCADLNSAELEGADFTTADLSDAQLNFAYLNGAVLSNVNFNGAYLKGTHLRRATLDGADFTDAHLTGADLWDVGLSQVIGLSAEQLELTRLCRTTMPDCTIEDRDCEAMQPSPSTNSTIETEPDSHLKY